MTPDEKRRRLERQAKSGGDEIDLNRFQAVSRRAMDGPFSHLEGEWAIFIDDYSHYLGLVTRQFTLGGLDILFHCEPLYQVSKFWDSNSRPAPPQNKVRIDNGPMVLRASRFKMIGKKPNDWQ